MIEPNQFITKTNLTLEDAIANSKPVPPWRQKLINDLKGNKNSSTVIVDGVNDQPRIPVVVKRTKNNRNLLRPLLVVLLFLHWMIVLITNIFDLISDAVGEIAINLTNFIRYNAQTEPTGDKPTD